MSQLQLILVLLALTVCIFFASSFRFCSKDQRNLIAQRAGMRSVLRLPRVLEIERVTQRNVPGVMCQICIGSSVLENPGFCCPIV